MYKAGKELGINPGIIKMSVEGLNKCKTGISKLNQQAYRFEYIEQNELPTESVPVKWRKQTFTCPNCQKQMQNGSEYNHLKKCVPKKSRLCGGCLNVTEHNGDICLECDHESDTERHPDDHLYKRERKFCKICNDTTTVSKSGDCIDCWWKKYQEDVDKKYNAIIEKIKNGKFPHKKQLQKHFPDVEFW